MNTCIFITHRLHTHTVIRRCVRAALPACDINLGHINPGKNEKYTEKLQHTQKTANENSRAVVNNQKGGRGKCLA